MSDILIKSGLFAVCAVALILWIISQVRAYNRHYDRPHDRACGRIDDKWGDGE